VVVIDALATSTAGWIRISGFYGPQPFFFGGVNVWFAFADATGVLVNATILYILATRLHGWKWLWLLVIPTISYGAVLGGVTAPMTLGLHSDWTTLGRWLGGAATIGLCCIVAHGCSLLTAALCGPTAADRRPTIVTGDRLRPRTGGRGIAGRPRGSAPQSVSPPVWQRHTAIVASESSARAVNTPPRTGRQGPRRCRFASRSAPECGRVVRQHEEPDPGPRPRPADPADATGPPAHSSLRLKITLKVLATKVRQRPRFASRCRRVR
jgi:hypothetical protein